MRLRSCIARDSDGKGRGFVLGLGVWRLWLGLYGRPFVKLENRSFR